MEIKKDFWFWIDIVGACNLRCPSCPTGNWKLPQPNPKGFMKPDMLERILDKAMAETNVIGVGIYNWNEPFLHPQLPELVKVVKDRKLNCDISTNLNIAKNFDAVLSHNAEHMRISCSGFTPAVYNKTHRGGDIEKVKENMKELAAAKARTGSITSIDVAYHRYLGNLDDEVMMKEFSEQLGFIFFPYWALMLPLEKVLAYVENDPTQAPITAEDLGVIENLGYPLVEGLQAVQKYKDKNCFMQSNQIAMDCTGRVQICCSTFDSTRYSLAQYLDTPLEQIQQMKLASDMCSRCYKAGVHAYYMGAPDTERDEMATRNVMKHYAKRTGLPFDKLQAKIAAVPPSLPGNGNTGGTPVTTRSTPPPLPRNAVLSQQPERPVRVTPPPAPDYAKLAAARGDEAAEKLGYAPMN